MFSFAGFSPEIEDLLASGGKRPPGHSSPCGGCASLNQDRRRHSQVSIPRQEPEFGTIAESVILCSGHRPDSMILTKQIMRTNSNEQGRR
jgi:hypothetical protein